MKKLIVWLLFIPVVLGNVQIHQVLYDPLNTESGGEFIQLYNDDIYPADISGWKIQTSTSPQDVVFPSGTIIPGESYYLIADKGWNESKDDSSWPDAHLEETITLKNSDSGIALLVDTLVIDAVGWGNAPDGLYEGTAAVDVEAGKSLLRVQDTGNNADDFIESIPVFSFNRNSAELTIEVEVVSGNISFSEIIIPDVDSKAGIQIVPRPGQVKQVPVSFDVISSMPVEVSGDFNGVPIIFNQSNTTFTGLFPVNYTLLPGTYNLTIQAVSELSLHQITLDVEVLPLLAFSLDASLLHLGNATPGSTIRVLGQTSLQNLGNIVLDFNLYASDLVNSESSILSSYLSVDLGEGFTSLENEQFIEVGLQSGGILPIDIELHIPDVGDGRYSGKITFVGIGG